MAHESSGLLAFVGSECPHCRRMEPIVAEVERQTGKRIPRLDVWHDQDNAALMHQYADALRTACGGLLGVPAYVNTETGEVLCGEVDFDQLRRWAIRSARGSPAGGRGSPGGETRAQATGSPS